MAQPASATIAPSERRGRRGSARFPLWVTATAAILVALGSSAQRTSGGETAARDRNQNHAPHRRNDAPAEADHGRLAHSPSDAPARGWKDILLRVYENVGRNRVVTIAAGVTFYSILALFPAIAALVLLYGLMADPTTIAADLNSLAGVLPGGAVQVIGDELKHLTAQRATLGLASLIALLTALWSANAGVKSLFDALNVVHNEPERRGFIRLNAVSLAFTAATIGILVLALGTMVVLPPLLDHLGAASGTNRVVWILRWPALLLAVALWLAALYRFGPSRTEPRWHWIGWGSGLAAALWFIVSLLFSWYAANFGTYDKTYGSLGAVIGFMVWMWLSTIVVLFGAEVDAEMERQTTRDTTLAATKPQRSSQSGA